MKLEDMKLYTLLAEVMKLPHAAISDWQRATWQHLNEQRVKEETAYKEKLGESPTKARVELDRANMRLREAEESLSLMRLREARLCVELAQALGKVKQHASHVQLVTASREDVWLWQGDPGELEDLTCPVVMNLSTLLELLGPEKK